jgi:hypothetical protein
LQHVGNLLETYSRSSSKFFQEDVSMMTTTTK